MKFTTLIPIRYNDGSPVDESELQDIVREFWTNYGGATIERTVQGYWLADGTLFEDECLKVVVSCDNERLTEVEHHIIKIGHRLRQDAMYLEVQYLDGVRILKIE
jgi:hypothetical protein